MITIREISNKKLIEYINHAKISTNMIFNKDCDTNRSRGMYSDLDEIYMKSITPEEYQSLINLAIRMGIPTMPISNLHIEDKDRLVIHMALLKEALGRKINIYDKKVRKGEEVIPETISEVIETNNFHNMGSDAVDSFDYPVRNACTVLFSKGYIPYWSSANRRDIAERVGLAIKGKNVAYILIDSKNLTDKLKSQLILNGHKRDWGAVREHGDNGNFYGIWVEITSPDMRCEEISESLFKQAVALPDIEKENRPNKKRKRKNN